MKMASTIVYQGFGTLKILGKGDLLRQILYGFDELGIALYPGRLLIRSESSDAGTHLDFLPKLLT